MELLGKKQIDHTVGVIVGNKARPELGTANLAQRPADRVADTRWCFR
jgi:hypothetical protein